MGLKRTGTCVIYGYCLGDEETHTHGLEGFLKDAHDYAEIFSMEKQEVQLVLELWEHFAPGSKRPISELQLLEDWYPIARR